MMLKYSFAAYKVLHCDQGLLVKYLPDCQKVSRWKQIGRPVIGSALSRIYRD